MRDRDALLGCLIALAIILAVAFIVAWWIHMLRMDAICGHYGYSGSAWTPITGEVFCTKEVRVSLKELSGENAK